MNEQQQIAAAITAQEMALAKLAPAYIKAVKACKNALKDANNPHLGNDYATLTSVLASVKDAFLDNDLWLLQAPAEIVATEAGPAISLVGMLLHASGQSIRICTQLPSTQYDKKLNAEKMTPQTAGSGYSYARRYQWLGVAGITQEDDDGEAASHIDTTQPPGKRVEAAVSEGLETKIAEAVEDKSMEKLKALRDEVQAAKSEKLSAAYLAARKAIKGES